MTADILEYGANIQAGAATDAMQRITLLGIGEQLRAPVVEQDDMKFQRTIRFTRLARAAE